MIAGAEMKECMPIGGELFAAQPVITTKRLLAGTESDSGGRGSGPGPVLMSNKMRYMFRIYLLLLSVVMLTAAGCSSTSTTTTRPGAAPQDSVARDASAGPDWFEKEVVAYDSLTIRAYAAAIGNDPADAEAKAVSRAATLLKQSVSGRLETVRSEGVQELGRESGLADGDFLIAFRKAHAAVDDAATVQQKSTQPVEGQSSSQGFAEVRVQRAELIKQMGSLFSSNEQTWETLIQSASFEKF
ncbi:MAG TPA: hypothetical protein VK074_03760 [Fodinibius sp.]|nr:hypothetical protein [Fodinibius sp.]